MRTVRIFSNLGAYSASRIGCKVQLSLPGFCSLPEESDDTCQQSVSGLHRIIPCSGRIRVRGACAYAPFPSSAVSRLQPVYGLCLIPAFTAPCPTSTCVHALRRHPSSGPPLSPTGESDGLRGPVAAPLPDKPCNDQQRTDGDCRSSFLHALAGCTSGRASGPPGFHGRNPDLPARRFSLSGRTPLFRVSKGGRGSFSAAACLPGHFHYDRFLYRERSFFSCFAPKLVLFFVHSPAGPVSRAAAGPEGARSRPGWPCRPSEDTAGPCSPSLPAGRRE